MKMTVMVMMEMETLWWVGRNNSNHDDEYDEDGDLLLVKIAVKMMMVMEMVLRLCGGWEGII